jgi:hypothetical protein
MWREKWMNMSDEEKLKFKNEWRMRCGRVSRSDDSGEDGDRK